MQASIIIRAKNEERWITSCLKLVQEQEGVFFEIIFVDNGSVDKTLERAAQFPVKIVRSSKITPGALLNEGMQIARGDFLVCLSAHCLPAGKTWLLNLLKPFSDPGIAGVYGRQQPMRFSSPQAVRDLTIVFGLDPKVQHLDPFFHNANSAIRRSAWLETPFDEEATNIEDRIWADAMIRKGFSIYYQPDASVYHYHGIHQDNLDSRMRTTVKVMEKLHGGKTIYEHGRLDPRDLSICAFVPQRGKSIKLGEQSLLTITVQQALRSRLLKEVYVLTDLEETAEEARKAGARVPFLRDKELSRDFVSITEVYAACLARLEEVGVFPDLLVCIEPTYPFRTPEMIDLAIETILEDGYDTVLPTRQENNPCWMEKNGDNTRVDEGDLPRHLKRNVIVGVRGLCCVTFPSFVREGRLFGERIGLFPVHDTLSTLEIRSEVDAQAFIGTAAVGSTKCAVSGPKSSKEETGAL